MYQSLKKINYKKLLVSVLPGLMVALAGCFMLFFYAPFELYLTNHKEFWFTSGQMMPTVLALFLGSFILIALVLIAARIINAKLYTAMLTIGFAAVWRCMCRVTFL